MNFGVKLRILGGVNLAAFCRRSSILVVFTYILYNCGDERF